MTTHEQIPPFLAEMPEPALYSYLSLEIAPKPLPSGLSQVMPWRDELLPADLRGEAAATALAITDRVLRYYLLS